MPTLYILCGVSGSGKSTWATEYMKDHDVRYVSRDEIRLSFLKEGDNYFLHEKQTFKKFSNTIAQTLVDGFDVIADATHINHFSRRKLTNAIDKFITDYNIVCFVFITPYDSCVKNNSKRSGRERVPDQVIKDMYNNFEMPSYQEDKRIINIEVINNE